MLDDYKPRWFDEPPRPPQYAEDIPIEPEVRAVLRERGVERLYSHQSRAIRAVREGKDIVLVAPTAAGKTECYMVPVVEAALKGQCSLLLFPTKALSRDQWNRLREFSLMGVRSAVYDGDTPESQRSKVRKDFPHVIITNVDMLHFMLLNRRLWAPFFARLKYVVIDEIHAYSGTLGSHVANVVWRLRRMIEKMEKAEEAQRRWLAEHPHEAGIAGTGEGAGGGGRGGAKPRRRAEGEEDGSEGGADLGQGRLGEDEEGGFGADAMPLGGEGAGTGGLGGAGRGTVSGGGADWKRGDEIDLSPRKPEPEETRAGAGRMQFICSSATIGNALEFAALLTGLPAEGFAPIIGDGAPRGRIHHAVINSEEESTVTTCVKAAKELGRKTLIFANSHNMAERLAMVGRRIDLPVSVYRSGLPPDERRDLEAAFHSGRVRTLAATSALELGMDVGDADAAILAGFPGTITRLRQRIGRVGRKGQECYAVMVARDNPLDQYYASNPGLYLHGLPESAYAKPENPYVRKPHLLAAARDWPVDEEDLREGDAALLAQLEGEGLVRRWGDSFISTPEGTKRTRTLSLRNAGPRVRIINADTGKTLGEREASIAIGELYEGAIYLLGGRRYFSRGIDLDEGVAKVVPASDDEPLYTQALRQKRARILEVQEEGAWGEVPLARGAVHITSEVTGYVLKDSLRGTLVSRRTLDEPLVHEFDTYGLWADWGAWADGRAAFAEGLHALEHVSIAMMPALTGADPAEIGGISHPEGRVFYYEGMEGGSGVGEIVFKRYGECIQMTLERLTQCPCKAGCPKCVFSPQCGNNNNYLDKEEAAKIARRGIEAAGASGS